jgi:hypothetical protein
MFTSGSIGVLLCILGAGRNRKMNSHESWNTSCRWISLGRPQLSRITALLRLGHPLMDLVVSWHGHLVISDWKRTILGPSLLVVRPVLVIISYLTYMNLSCYLDAHHPDRLPHIYWVFKLDLTFIKVKLVYMGNTKIIDDSCVGLNQEMVSMIEDGLIISSRQLYVI